MQPVATLPLELAVPVAHRPSGSWNLVSALFVGALVAFDRMLELFGR